MALPQITWQDVQELPDDGNRYEAIEGELYVTPAPPLRHQTILGRLYLAFHRFLVEPGRGRVWFAPTGVEFPATGEGVQPDLLFVSNARRGVIAERWLMGAPDLVVEVLSPTTARRDRGIKLRLYEQQGVAEYWVVDPEAQAVEAWRFASHEEVTAYERHTETIPVHLADQRVGEIDLNEIFAPD